MTDRDDFDTDAELRMLLRTSDPARSLPPADPATLAHLLEDVMSTDLEVRPEEPTTGTRATGTHGRSRATWLVAAAAAVVIAGAGGYAATTLGGDQDAPPSAGSTTTDPGRSGDAGAPGSGSASAPVPGTTQLQGPSAAVLGARCAVPTAAMVATQDQAFEGTVTAIDGQQVTLSTDSVYQGEVAQTVVVQAASPELRRLVDSTKFEVGGTYLVSASDGVVGVCGLSGQAGPELTALYSQAFAR